MGDFAARLRELRKKRGLRQQDLGDMLGLAQTTIANYERRLRFPDEKTLGKIADYFDTSLDFLLGRTTREVEARQLAGPRERPRALTGLGREYFGLLRRGERDAAFRLVSDALENGLGMSTLYLDVFGASLYETGRMWAAGRMSVAEEHYFSESTQLLISRLHERIAAAARPKRGLRCAIFAAYGENHVIGARMISDFFELDGWDVYYLRGNLSIRHAMSALLNQATNLLALSITLAENLGAAEDLIAAVRGEESLRSVKILVGGQALGGIPAFWQELGADGTARDAVAAVAEADRLLGAPYVDEDRAPGPG